MSFLVLAMMLPGCANMFAKQAIEQFAVSMAEQDLESMRANTSNAFEQKALRQPEALKDMKILRLPKGEIEVTEVVDISKTEKKVLATIGEAERAANVEYRLVHDSRTGKWVIDDVILGQDADGEGVRRSVTEQMDLLLTCREFLNAWRDGTRSDQLAHCDGELKKQLEILPPNWLSVVSKRVVGSKRRQSFRPEARLNGDRAVVVLPHAEGNLFLEFNHRSGNWLVDNAAIEPKSEEDTGVRSLTKLATALNQSAVFLAAYGTADRDALGKSATTDFYKQCLAAADIESLPIPVAELLADEYEVRQFKDRMEMLLEGTDATYMLTLLNEEPTLPDGTKGTAETRIDEVTIFEKNSSDVKRISAVFMSHAVINLFADALMKRDVGQLKELSSADFNERVWGQNYAKHFAILPYPEVEDGPVEVISSAFRGDITEITIARGNSPMTFVMRQARGWMVIDDVIIPSVNRPTSLKENLEVILPAQAFASAVHRRSLKDCVKESADSLDRIVWLQMNEFPDFGYDLVRPLMSEIVGVGLDEGFKAIRTSDGQVSATVRLRVEGNRYVVHDVVLFDESNPTQRVELIQTMRQQIASSQQGRPSKLRRVASVPTRRLEPQTIPTPPDQRHILKASHETAIEPAPSQIQPASQSIPVDEFDNRNPLQPINPIQTAAESRPVTKRTLKPNTHQTTSNKVQQAIFEPIDPSVYGGE